MGVHDAFWDDGEWISWDEIERQIENKEWRARFPGADLSVVQVFLNLLETAREYHEITGRRLVSRTALPPPRGGRVLFEWDRLKEMTVQERRHIAGRG